FRGEVDKYTWVDVGSSYLPSDVLAALLVAQLERVGWIQQRRTKIWRAYADGLAGWAADNDVGLPVVPAHCEQPGHLFYLLLPTPEDRQRFMAHLRARGIHSVFHYHPLHLSEMGQKFGGRRGDCPVAESVSDRLVRLPLYPGLADDELEHILEEIR